MKQAMTMILVTVIFLGSSMTHAGNDRAEAAAAGVAVGAAGLWFWQKFFGKDPKAQDRAQAEVVIQQHPVYRPHPTFNGQRDQFIPQQEMNMPTAFQEPCQGPGHHAKIYDRYGSVIAVRVC